MNRGTEGSEVVPRFFVKLGTDKTSIITKVFRIKIIKVPRFLPYIKD